MSFETLKINDIYLLKVKILQVRLQSKITNEQK